MNRDIRLYEMSLTIHSKDHEPDWPFGVCRICGLGQIKEIPKDDPENSS